MLKETLHRPIRVSNSLLIIIILILFAGNVFFAVKKVRLQNELEGSQRAVSVRDTHERVLDFTGLFIEKVLKSEGEVDFDTRLILEQRVRDLNDQEILAQWQKFTDSQTEIQAQENVKNLLELLIEKARR